MTGVIEPRTADASLNPLVLLASLWTGASVEQAIADEEALLKHFVRSPYRIGHVTVQLPTLDLGAQRINTLDIHPDLNSTDEAPIVWLHGAGAGLGFGFRNFDTLANLGGERRRVLALDWLGQAGSSRPSFPSGGLRPAWTLSESQQIEQAIRFSVDSLEAWRAALDLERIDLVAHSMGGYLATQYALAHPERVRRLVLVSPVGWAAKPEGELATRGRAGGLFGALWDAGIGNFGAARMFGRGVGDVAKRAVVGRFRIRDEQERALVASYFWSALTSQPVSAEKTVNFLLEPYFAPAPFGFYAKRPVSAEPAERLRALPPTTLLYGSHDLHYIPTMPDAVKRVAAVATNPVSMAFVSDSDHHLYLDNPTEFAQKVAQALGK